MIQPNHSSSRSRFWQAVKDLQFISAFFSWFFMLLSRLAEPCMLLAVLYVIVEAGVPQVTIPTLHTLAIAVMIAAPEVILPGAFVITRKAKESGEETRPLTAICWLFVVLTLITLLSLFVLHLNNIYLSLIMCLRCGAGVGYSIFVRMLSYKGLAVTTEAVQEKEQTAPCPQLIITPELVDLLQGFVSTMLTQAYATIREDRASSQTLAFSETKQLALRSSETEEQAELSHVQQSVPREQVAEPLSEPLSNYERVKAYLTDHPQAKVAEVADALTIAISTASKHMNKVRQEEAKRE